MPVSVREVNSWYVCRIMEETPVPNPESTASEPVTPLARRVLLVDDNPGSAEMEVLALASKQGGWRQPRGVATQGYPVVVTFCSRRLMSPSISCRRITLATDGRISLTKLIPSTTTS